jgi:hypothetical protein
VKYLATPPPPSRFDEQCNAGIGVMMTPRSFVSLEQTLRLPFWGADNGCYSQGDKFRIGRYYQWLGKMTPARETCLFATAPDVLGDAVATWERSRDCLPKLRELGYKAALVAQDDIERTTIEWDSFDVLFVGGTTKWKLSEGAYGVVKQAKLRGKTCHMGRVNSFRRLRAAKLSGFDSADGTRIAFKPTENLAALVSWLHALKIQPPLRLWEA